MMSRKITVIYLLTIAGLLSCLIMGMSLNLLQLDGGGSGQSLQSNSGLENNPARNKRRRTHLDLRIWPSVEDLPYLTDSPQASSKI